MREENIVGISEYLKKAFPGSVVENEEVSLDHIFRVVDRESGGELHRLMVGEEFLDDTAPLDVDEELERFEVARIVGEAGGKTVTLSSEGVEVAGA